MEVSESIVFSKNLIRANRAKNDQLLNNINDGLIDLRNAIIKKEFTENENSNKIANIADKISILIIKKR